MLTVEEVQAQLTQANINIKGLVAQLEATKQMFNEQISTSLQLRTNLHIFQQDNQALARQIETLTKKVLELSPPVTVTQPSPDGTVQPESDETPIAEIPPIT